LIVLDPLYALIAIGLLLTIIIHLDHVTVSTPTIRRSLSDIKEPQQLFLIIIFLLQSVFSQFLSIISILYVQHVVNGLETLACTLMMNVK